MTLDSDRGATRAEWRRRLRERRRAVSPEHAGQLGGRIARLLEGTSAWRQAQTLGIYLDRDGEVPTQAVIDAARREGKTLFLPAVQGKELELRRWDPDVALVNNRFRIQEPPPSATRSERVELLIMPLVGWSSGGVRLGMGGGFYDRLLARSDGRPGVSIGLAYECQREESLGDLREPWDKDIDAVITERGVYDFAAAQRGGITPA
ncbi:MAG: 5-formyltetrahydrofolate cyclo-ligase [Halieaceae bacterium]|jgi:5-formyltetrahydrofolate cyclo-ligase|nr:5-formyltetrahydrofolate cyclo-ligase [Halieaceae bacterium]